MRPRIQPRLSTSDGVFDSSCGTTVVPGFQKALVDCQTQLPVNSRAVVAPDRIVNQCLELIMLAQGFVFFVAALAMLAR